MAKSAAPTLIHFDEIAQMNRLPGRVQLYIVQQLAGFAPPSEVVKAVRQVFDLAVTPQQVEAYNPERVAGAHLRPMLRQVFYATRQVALSDASEIGIFHPVIRLRILERLFERADQQGNSVLAARILEIAAKEMGGLYTNRRGGGPERQVR